MKCQGWLGWLVLMTALFASSVRGDELAWQPDYAQARKEAEQQNRPLFILFVSNDAPLSGSFEMQTLRDNTVIGTLNARYVLLRVEADKQPALVQALKIEKFPTVVLAGPNGRILGTKDAALDPAELLGFLRNAGAEKPSAPPTTTTGDPHEKTVAEARAALAESNFNHAVELLQSVIKDSRRSPSQARAAEILKDVEQQAEGRLQQGLKLQADGKQQEAYQILNEVSKLFAGTKAGMEAGPAAAKLLGQLDTRTQDRARIARDIMVLAREDFRLEQYLSCLDRCEMLAQDFADLPEASEANQLSGGIKNHPEWLQKVCDAIPQRYGMLYLAMADSQLKLGQPQQAMYYLELIQQAFPNSRAAELAKIRKAQIQGGPGVPGM